MGSLGRFTEPVDERGPKMPFVTNAGVRIHYEVDGDGPPLVLQHALLRSLEMWYDFGYAQALRTQYRLILIDARGHGASDKPHDSHAYAPETRALDVTAVLDEIGIDSTHYMGYSMGARIGFAMLAHAPSRLRSLVLGGMSPYQTPDTQRFEAQLRQGLANGMEAFVSAIEARNGRLPSKLRARFLDNDAAALLAAVDQAAHPTGQPVNWDKLLPATAIPALLYVGGKDPFLSGAKKCASLMPEATLVELPGLDHSGAIVRSDLVLPHVIEFLAEVTKAQRGAD